MMNEDYVFRFKFAMYGSSSESMMISVLSDNSYYMQQFLRQHNMVDGEYYVETLHIGDGNIPSPDECDSYIKPFIFKSNKTKNEYVVYTSKELLNDAIVDVGGSLSEVLLMGPAIIQTDYEIIECINELINNLRYIFPMDHQLIDEETDLPISPSWGKYTKQHGLDYYSDYGPDDSYIYDSLFDDSIDDKPQPITIEAYVSYIASILVKRR